MGLAYLANQIKKINTALTGKASAASVSGLAGTGRTNETVKGNADAVALKASQTDLNTATASLAAIMQDVVDLVAGGGNTLNGSVTSENFTATASQTVFALTDTDGVIFAVVVQGAIQRLTTNYTLNESKNTATLSEGATLNDEVELYYFKALSVAGTVTEVSSANGDISVATGTSTPVLTLNTGTTANKIVKLDGDGKLPAIDGSQLTNIGSGHDAVTVTDTNTLDLTVTGQAISGLVLAVKDQNTATGVTQAKVWTGTQAEYDAIETPDTATLYFIKTA